MEKEESGMKSQMPSRPHKEQSGNVSSGIGTALVENRKLAKEGPDGSAMG